MATIQFEGDFDKAEDAFVLAYAEIMFADNDEPVTIKRIPEENVTRPDYFITNTGELLEVKEVHDRAHTEQWASWGRKVSEIRRALESLGTDADVLGTYIVGVPEVFTLTRNHKGRIEGAKIIVEAISTGQKYVDVFGERFTVDKISDQENVISFSNISEARSLNPPATVAQNMKAGINKANQQLGSPPAGVDVKSRKLLFINKYIFGLHDWELFNAASQVFSELRTATNIEETWFQMRDNKNVFIHKRIYNKKFFDELEASNYHGWSAQDCELFSDWFLAISERSDALKDQLFLALKVLLENKKPHEIFTSAQNRMEMVRFGLWLIEQKRYDDTCWLIEQFLDDPNVTLDADGRDVALELEEQIKQGDEVVQITTVLGQLSWLVNELNVSKKHVARAAKYTLKLLENDNLYIKSQALIPLNELVRRQTWLKDYDTKHGTTYFPDIRSEAFSLMRNFGEYQTMANLLSKVFYYLLDISEGESLEVLQKLKHGKSIGWLYIFYSLFRSGQAQTQEFGAYDDTAAKAQLQSVIQSDEEIDERLLADISWRLWKYLADHPEDFEKLEFVISDIAKRPYQKANYSLEHIIQEWVERKPEKCTEWFIELVDNMLVSAGNDERIGGRLWLSAEETLPIIAKRQPEQLIDVIDKLILLWDKGAMIGHPSSILTSYKHIADPALRESTKASLVSHYKHMKKVQPKLEVVDFT